MIETGSRHADRVRDLHLAAISKSGRDDVLRHVPRRVGGRTVDLGRVLAAERAATVPRHAAVGVDDDLAAGQAASACGPPSAKSTGRVHVDLGVLVDHVGRHNGVDNLLQHRLLDLGVGNRIEVLRGDNDCLPPAQACLRGTRRDLALAIGQKYGTSPDLRASDRRRVRRCASAIGIGISSGVSLQA